MIESTHKLPAKFGPYYLFEMIGKGGMAEIFLAKTFTNLGTERLCVLKRILPHLNEDKSFCEMLISEAKLCANLSNTNIVQTYELGQIRGQYYIAMEYVEGVDLNQLLGLLSRAQIALPLPFALFIIIETLRGLDHAHRLEDADDIPLKIVHRDVSPTNVLISTEGEVKLCDFGIAKVSISDDHETDKNLNEYHLKGKVAYMAPEHIAGEQIDLRADLFAAGILLWELLSGRRLFKRKDEAETFKLATDADIQPLVDRGFIEFETLEAIVHKALEKKPDDRFQSGQEFINAIEDYLHLSGQIVSQLKFADFLMENFGEKLEQQRRERERHLSLLMKQLNEEEMSRQWYEEDQKPSFTDSLLTGSDELDDDNDDDTFDEFDNYKSDISSKKTEPQALNTDGQKITWARIFWAFAAAAALTGALYYLDIL